MAKNESVAAAATTAGSSTDAPKPSALDNVAATAGKVRWTICALIFAATTINYIDRQILSILKPVFDQEFHWTQSNYALITAVFSGSYAFGQLCVGYLLDKFGVRRGFGLAVLLWSLAAMAHGLLRYVPMNGAFAHSDFVLAAGGMSVVAFAFARMLLGLSESANFPAGIKTIAHWFPQRERSSAAGWMNAGSNVGALITPLVVPLIATSLGWPVAFYATGSLGFLWLIAWWRFYREPNQHPKLTAEENAYIHRDPPEKVAKISYAQVIGKPQTWAFAIGKLLTDPVWWFYLFWIPDFLNKQYHLDLKKFGPPVVVIYLMADVGSIGGGWLSSRLIARGWSVNAARKTTMLICALCVVPIIAASHVSNLWVAVLLIGLAASAHQGWSSNLFTLVSDTAPRGAVGSVMGFGGMAGTVGAMLFQLYIGRLLDATHNNYQIPFFVAGCAYLLALLFIQLLTPRLEPMRFPGPYAGESFTTENPQ